MKRSLSLLALMPFCLLADSETFAKPETEKTTDSVTYLEKLNSLGRINAVNIEKIKSSDSTTYSYIMKEMTTWNPAYRRKMVNNGVTWSKEGKRISYTKNRRTKKITVSNVENDRPDFSSEFFRSCTEEEKKERFKLLEALFGVVKHKAFPKENKYDWLSPSPAKAL